MDIVASSSLGKHWCLMAPTARCMGLYVTAHRNPRVHNRSVSGLERLSGCQIPAQGLHVVGYCRELTDGGFDRIGFGLREDPEQVNGGGLARNSSEAQDRQLG